MPSNPYSFAPQGVSGDDLTKITKSLNNILGQQGQQATATGQQAFGSGMGGLQSLLKYYQGIMSGSSSSLMNQLPEVRSVLSQYDAARSSIANTEGRGGPRASQGAEAKFKELGDVGSLVQKARTGAAEGAGATAGTIASAGISESDLGSKDWSTALQSLLQQRGQNMSSPSTFDQILKGISVLF